MIRLLIMIYLKYVDMSFSQSVLQDVVVGYVDKSLSSQLFFERSSSYPSAKLNLVTFLELSIWLLWLMLMRACESQSFKNVVQCSLNNFCRHRYSLGVQAVIRQQKKIYSCFWNPQYDTFDINLQQHLTISALIVRLFAISAADEKIKLCELYLREEALNSLVFEFFWYQSILQHYTYHIC